MDAQVVGNGRHRKKRRRASTHSLKDGKRSLSEGSKAPSKKRDVSREPSTGSSAMSLDVRCACQYFQCDSLLPDKISLVGTRPSSRLDTTMTRDHEYEPVNPPPDNETFPSPAPTIHIMNIDQEPKYVQPITDIVITTPVDPIVKDEINNKTAATDTSMHIFTSATTVNDGQPPEPILSTNEKHKESPNKFQLAFKQKTEQLKLKLHNIKKPHITAPQKPKPQKVKTEKSKINFPKIPNTTKINLPSFNFGRRRSENRSLKQRQLSTESNAGDSKKPIFDFSTYPRIFKKKSKVSTGDDMDASPDFATVPRGSKKTKPGIQSETTVTWGGTDAIRIPLHPEEYFNAENEERMIETERESPENVIDTREDSLERRMASHIRYDEDIDSEDEYERENHDINRDEFVNRWDYGNFNLDSNQEYLNNFKNSQYKVTDLDSPEDIPGQNEFRTNENKETYSSGSSLGMQRVGGVLEEIDSDEFFLRQKGISQDNIEVGMLLSSEIREAFRMPENALSKMQDPYERDFDHKGSNQSLPEARGKHKAIKKPKRKKTPHASQEKIPYVEESADEDLDVLPPSRPKRRSKRIKKLKNDDIIPYQETISLGTGHPERFLDHRESLGILGDDEREIENNAYENEVMEGKEQPEIKATDAYSFELVDINKFNKDNSEERPAAPPRKQKSLKSLNLSEDGSIPEDINIQQYIADFNDEKMQTNAESVIPPSHQPPQRPIRMRSHTSSQSIITSTWDDESLKTENFDNQTPCVEEPCTREIVDYMGYAIIDKQKVRDPPLPPPRAPQRHKRSVKDKFFTVPRPAKGSDSPVRPLRNYSTLSQTKRNTEPATYENKENIDIMQYIESDDSNRNLQSGEILNKMKDRPLPAPPRPPRKSKPLQDITSKENISEISDEECKADFEEIEVSTQTEPLPEDFICEEVTQKASETILLPSNLKSEQDKGDVNQTKDAPTVKRKLITPTYFTHEETITHGSLLVQALEGSKILPDSEITVSNERIIPITTDSDGETSSIPEDFKQLKSPCQENIKSSTPSDSLAILQNINPEMKILKAQKLQVTDLDVDTLTVNKLLAEKIIVSEIDSNNIQTNEISSKSGALKVGEIELPPGIIQQIIKSINTNENQKLQSEAKKEIEIDDENSREQKKTPIVIDTEADELAESIINNYYIEIESSRDSQRVSDHLRYPHQTGSIEAHLQNTQTPNPREPNSYSVDAESSEINSEPFDQIHQHPSTSTHSEIRDEQETVQHVVFSSDECPQRPPRQSEKINSDGSLNNDQVLQEPEIDDEPPPRPPEPQLEYLPSQPPASFYALRAQNYVDTLADNIPVVPRRRRQPKSKPISRSSSEESAVTPVSRRFHTKSSEPSISQLSGQLARSCGTAANSALKRLMTHITNNVLQNADGKQDIHVMVIILLVLIAGLILLGYGDEKTVIHLHHWEFFNPPKDM